MPTGTPHRTRPAASTRATSRDLCRQLTGRRVRARRHATRITREPASTPTRRTTTARAEVAMARTTPGGSASLAMILRPRPGRRRHRMRRLAAPVVTKRLIAGLALAGALVIPATADAETFIGNRSDPARALVYPEKRPRDLWVGGPTNSTADSIWLQRVRWSSWGGRSARATARWRFRTYEPWVRMRVRAYRLRRCVIPASPATNNEAVRFRLYTRVSSSRALTLTDEGGWTHTWKAPGCRGVIVT